MTNWFWGNLRNWNQQEFCLNKTNLKIVFVFLILLLTINIINEIRIYVVEMVLNFRYKDYTVKKMLTQNCSALEK